MLMWQEEEQKMMKKKSVKGSKDNISEALKTLIKTTPQEVKEAVILKWLKYQSMIYLSKVMVYRRAIHKIGFPNRNAHICYMMEYQEKKEKFDRQIKFLLKTTHADEFNWQQNLLRFVEDESNPKKQIEDCPPLLDPVVVKSGQTKMMELHKKWCAESYAPAATNSRIDMSQNYLSYDIPDERETCNNFYIRLARDFPYVMEFVPTPKVMQKLIERATQIDIEKIDTTLNPFSKYYATEEDESQRRLDPNLKTLRCKQTDFYYPNMQNVVTFRKELGLDENCRTKYKENLAKEQSKLA